MVGLFLPDFAISLVVDFSSGVARSIASVGGCLAFFGSTWPLARSLFAAPFFALGFEVSGLMPLTLGVVMLGVASLSAGSRGCSAGACVCADGPVLTAPWGSGVVPSAANAGSATAKPSAKDTADSRNVFSSTSNALRSAEAAVLRGGTPPDEVIDHEQNDRAD